MLSLTAWHDYRQALIVRVFLPIGWLASLALVLSGCTSQPPPVASDPVPAAPTDFLSPEELQAEIANYAQAILEIESIRIEMAVQVEQIAGSVPFVVCNQPDTLDAVAGDIQDIVVNYCTRAKEIGESYELTASRFNEITDSLASDPDLRQKIQEELLRQQQTSFTQ